MAGGIRFQRDVFGILPETRSFGWNSRGIFKSRQVSAVAKPPYPSHHSASNAAVENKKERVYGEAYSPSFPTMLKAVNAAFSARHLQRKSGERHRYAQHTRAPSFHDALRAHLACGNFPRKA